MNRYIVELAEILQRQIEVEANSESEAIEKVSLMYKNEEIVLNSDDFIEVEIDIVS